MDPLLSILHFSAYRSVSRTAGLLLHHKFRGNGNNNGGVASRCVWAPCARGMDDWGGGLGGAGQASASRPEEPGGSDAYPSECGEVDVM